MNTSRSYCSVYSKKLPLASPSGPLLITVAPSSGRSEGLTLNEPVAAVPQPPSDPQGTYSSSSSGKGEIKLTILRDGQAVQNDIFNIKYTRGLLGLSIQDEGESETL